MLKKKVQRSSVEIIHRIKLYLTQRNIFGITNTRFYCMIVAIPVMSAFKSLSNEEEGNLYACFFSNCSTDYLEGVRQHCKPSILQYIYLGVCF